MGSYYNRNLWNAYSGGIHGSLGNQYQKIVNRMEKGDFKGDRPKNQRMKEVKPTTFYNPGKRKQGPTLEDGTFSKKIRSTSQMKSVINSQAGRASMTVKGKGKARPAHGKKVKVSRKLRTKIKEVIQAAKVRGTYITSRQGFVGIVKAPSAQTTNQTVNFSAVAGIGASTAVQAICYNSFNGNTRCWWQGPSQAFTLPATVANAFSTGDDWQFFTPLKILDAASVLWNDKTIDRNYTKMVGNFQMSETKATGVPVAGSTTNPNRLGQIIEVVNSFVTFELKNNTQRTMTLVFYHCKSKLKFNVITPLAQFIGGTGTTEVDTGTASAHIRCGTSNPIPETLQNDPMVEPNHFDGFRSLFTYEKVTVVIAPGETCTHNIQGPKNYRLDFSKLQTANNDFGGCLYAPTTIGVMCSALPDLVSVSGGTTIVGGTTGRYVNTPATGPDANYQLSLPVSVEVKEHFTLAMPENTGFFVQAFGANTVQTLGLRRPMRAYGNFCTPNLSFGIAYTRFDEENPIAFAQTGGTSNPPAPSVYL